MADTPTRILTWAEPDLPPHLKRGAIEVLEAAYGPSGRTLEQRMTRPLAHADYTPTCMLLVEDTPTPRGTDSSPSVLAYLHILTKDIEHHGRRYRAAGLGAVSSLPTRRGEGHASRLVGAALERISAPPPTSGPAQEPPDIGVFTCDEPLAPWYQRLGHHLGWTVMPATVVIGSTRQHPFRANTLRNPAGEGKATLMAFLSEDARTHRPDFEGAPTAAVDLYLDLREGDLW